MRLTGQENLLQTAEMIRIQFNGEPHILPESKTLSELIQLMKLLPSHYAIALNGNVIPKSEHSQVFVQEGDRIELVHAVGGG